MNNALPITPALLAAAQEILAAQAALAATATAAAAAWAAWQNLSQAASAAELAAGRQAAHAAEHKRRAALGKVTRTERALDDLCRRAVYAERQASEQGLAEIPYELILLTDRRAIALPASRLATAALAAAKA